MSTPLKVDQRLKQFLRMLVERKRLTPEELKDWVLETKKQKAESDDPALDKFYDEKVLFLTYRRRKKRGPNL